MAKNLQNYLYVEQVVYSSHMPLHFYPTSKVSHKRVQPVRHKYGHICLSHDACTAIAAQQKEALRRFQEAIQTTWGEIDRSAKTLAATHHKSVKYMHSQLYMGRQTLHAKRKKKNTWNTFIWKRGEERRNNAESKLTSFCILFLAHIRIPRCIPFMQQAIPSAYCQE